jgi:solute carrier family 30 (zinc transporter), member 9
MKCRVSVHAKPTSRPFLSLRFFSAVSPPSSFESTTDDSHSKPPCSSRSLPYDLQFTITPVSKGGYKITSLVTRRRQFSSTDGSSSGSSSTSTSEDEAIRRLKERRRRLTVVYPYSEQDILRKQHIRKELARERTVANVNRALLGNVIIASAKLAAWFSSQSSSMMSEFIHSCVDCANQYLLLKGLQDSSNVADRKHPYGYGKSVYFWALVSALGTFFMGCGVSMSHAWGELMNPSLHEIGPEVLGVLAFSFAVDGYVLFKTIRDVRGEIPKNRSFWNHVRNMRDPATLAILLEDGAACFGVLLAIAGTTFSHATGNPIYDGLAGCSISLLLGSMGFVLARVNYRFLLGQAVDKEITDGIAEILKSRRSIESVASVQSQWTGPDTFSYKAEVDFDGTFLAAKLMPTHEKEFLNIRDNMKKDLPLVLSWYAEDVIRTVEQEVRILEHQVRKRYPAAEFIELEPMSKDSHEFAIDDHFEKDLRRAENENLEHLRKLIPSLDTIDAENKPSGAPTSPEEVLGSSAMADFNEFASNDHFESDFGRAENENLENLRRRLPSLDTIAAENKPSGAPTSPEDVPGSPSEKSSSK